MDELLAALVASPAVRAAATAVAGAAVALWLAAAWWAYCDAGRRTESSLAAYLASGWIVLSTPLMLPLALLVYRFARPQVPAADARASALARELGATSEDGPLCTGCSASVDAAWQRCPDCATWLGAPCASCSQWSDQAFEICPWCGVDREPAEVPARLIDLARHGTAAADAVSATADASETIKPQRRAISSARPLSYAASRDISSAAS